MSALVEIYLKKEALETLLKAVTQRNQKGIGITISINDESREFDGQNGKIYQNVSAYVSQTKEQREAKKEKYYVGNGSVFWTDGKITKAGATANEIETIDAEVVNPEPTDDLPF